jgi:hypothetical protein
MITCIRVIEFAGGLIICMRAIACVDGMPVAPGFVQWRWIFVIGRNG